MRDNRVIILHQYYFPSHFAALYKKDMVDRYILLSYRQIINKFLKSITKVGVLAAGKELLRDLIYSITKNQYKNRIIIIGIEPGNKKVYKLKSILKSNKCIYFTSFPNWEHFSDGYFVDFIKDRFDSIAFVNNYGYTNFIRKFGEIKSQIVNHSLNTLEYEKKTKQNSGVKFLFVGQLIERKRIDLIIDFFQQNPDLDISLDLIGKGVLEQQLIETTKNDTRIELLGFISKDKLKSLIPEYDYLILPSSKEPFGLVLIEALSSGVPCIISDGIGPREIIEDGYNGFVSFDDSLDNVMHKAIEIYNNSKLYWEISKNSLESSQKYDTEEVYKIWKKLV